MYNLSSSTSIFVCTKPVDMRRSFNGLYALTQSIMKQDPFSRHFVLFKSRRGDFLKVFWWDLDGLAIFSKRLKVCSFQFPEVRFVDGAYEPVEIERAQFLLMLEGIDTSNIKKHKCYQRDKVAKSA